MAEIIRGNYGRCFDGGDASGPWYHMAGKVSNARNTAECYRPSRKRKHVTPSPQSGPYGGAEDGDCSGIHPIWHSSSSAVSSSSPCPDDFTFWSNHASRRWAGQHSEAYEYQDMARNDGAAYQNSWYNNVPGDAYYAAPARSWNEAGSYWRGSLPTAYGDFSRWDARPLDFIDCRSTTSKRQRPAPYIPVYGYEASASAMYCQGPSGPIFPPFPPCDASSFSTFHCGARPCSPPPNTWETSDAQTIESWARTLNVDRVEVVRLAIHLWERFAEADAREMSQQCQPPPFDRLTLLAACFWISMKLLHSRSCRLSSRKLKWVVGNELNGLAKAETEIMSKLDWRPLKDFLPEDPEALPF